MRFLISIILTVFCLLLSFDPKTVVGEEYVVPGKFYVIGLGPAGPEHATLKAIDCLEKADLIVSGKGLIERFHDYLRGKTILADPSYKAMSKGKKRDKLDHEERKKLREKRILYVDGIIKKIREEVVRGKNVALLDSGDPCLFSPAHWIIEGFEPEEVEIIPGVGCFTVGTAALKKSTIPSYDTRFLLQSAPYFFYETRDYKLKEVDNITNILGRYPVSYAFYMAIKFLPRMIDEFKKYHPHDLPVAIVYWAGYPGKEKVVKGTLDTIMEKLSEKEKKDWMGMVYIGRFLEGKPYRTGRQIVDRKKSTN